MLNKRYIGILFYILLYILVEVMKRYACYIDEETEIFKRPEGAKDCGTLNGGGDCDCEPGFPSGHLASITFLIISIFIFSENRTIKKFILYNIPIIIMWFCRYHKKCHTHFQLLVGYGLGILFVVLYSNIAYRVGK
jgi:hypothetical protein